MAVELLVRGVFSKLPQLTETEGTSPRICASRWELVAEMEFPDKPRSETKGSSKVAMDAGEQVRPGSFPWVLPMPPPRWFIQAGSQEGLPFTCPPLGSEHKWAQLTPCRSPRPGGFFHLYSVRPVTRESFRDNRPEDSLR